ncbi:Sperm flagellar protein 2, partial [Gonioctena quinquepunctata]
TGENRTKRKGHAIIVHEDKFTQIPEVVYEEVEIDEIKGPAEPGEPGWEYVRVKFPEELLILLAGIWENLELIYIKDFSQVLFMKRIILNAIMPAVNALKKHMKCYVDKPDDKQQFLRRFQKIYNDFDDDIRKDEEFKAEMHCRVDEMKKKLLEVCDRSMMEAEQERCRFLNRGWTSRQLIELVNNYINAFQLEIDRNVDTLMILTDYYIGAITKLPNEEGFLKEILPKYDFDDPEIFACITNVLENVDQENNENPLDATIKQVSNKALAVAHKCHQWAWSIFEKGKSKLLPSGEREKANKKQKKTEKGN